MMNNELISMIETLLNEKRELTCKSLSIVAGLEMKDAIKSLEDYRKLKSGEDVHAVFFVSGSCGNVHKCVLVKEGEKAKHLANLDVVFSDHLYSLSVGSSLTKKPEHNSTTDGRESRSFS